MGWRGCSPSAIKHQSPSLHTHNCILWTVDAFLYCQYNSSSFPQLNEAHHLLKGFVDNKLGILGWTCGEAEGKGQGISYPTPTLCNQPKLYWLFTPLSIPTRFEMWKLNSGCRRIFFWKMKYGVSRPNDKFWTWGTRRNFFLSRRKEVGRRKLVGGIIDLGDR